MGIKEVKDHTTPFNNSLHYLGNIVWNAFKPLPCIIIYTSSSKGTTVREETSFDSLMASTRTTPQEQRPLWWSLIIPFCGVHLAAAYGVYCRPMSTVPTAILVATIVVCQLANFGCVYMYLM